MNLMYRKVDNARLTWSNRIYLNEHYELCAVAYKASFMDLITSIIVGVSATGGSHIPSNVLRPWWK